MIIDCTSDLHGYYPELKGGDLLIVAGDLTRDDYASSQLEFLSCLQHLNYKKKILIAGNHDNWAEDIKNGNPFSHWKIEYLCDSGTEFEYEEPSSTEWGANEASLSELNYEKKKMKIWGSPWTKRFPGMNPKCMAFTVDTEEELEEKWKLIPDDVDILVTHSPPYGIMDQVERKYIDIQGTLLKWNENVGSKSLSNKTDNLKNLKIHIFGHVHEGYGHLKEILKTPNIHLANASHVNERYEPVNKPIRIIL